MEKQKNKKPKVGVHSAKKNNAPIVIGIVAVAVVAVVAIFVFGRGGGNGNNSGGNNSGGFSTIISGHPMQTKEPLDENTYYMKDYVGRNASDTCTWRLSGDCMDSYGDANLKMVFIADDGQKINDGNISFYRVVEQNIEPNTELRLSGAENSIVTKMNYEEITLKVQVSAVGKKVASKTEHKTGQLERYVCTGKDNGVVTKFVSKNASQYLSGDSYDLVECSWDETTYYLE